MPSRNTILETIEDWRSKLLDLKKGNRLLNCRIGPKAAVEFLHPSPEQIWDHLANRDSALAFALKTGLVDAPNQSKATKARLENSTETADEAREDSPERRTVPFDLCLASRRLKPDHILTELSDAQLSTRLKRLALNARTSIEEQGINILYVAFGLLQWYEAPHSDEVLIAPLLLLPVSLVRPGVGELWTLRPYENEVVENQCLKEMLRVNFRLELPAYSENDEQDAAPDPFDYFKRVRKFLARKEAATRWQILPRVALQTFSFQKIAMWEDLGKNSQRVASHPICRSLAGESGGMTFETDGLPSANEFDDRISPLDVHSILDSDSSQLEAVVTAKHGVNLVLDGPPGTGKSQTIANIIAECLASNKSVLFVSEKMAALSVVKRRLDSQNLGDFCLECHSHKANKKQILAELNRCLSLPAERYRDQTASLSELSQVRARLNSYVKAIHERKGALAASPFQVHGRLATVKPTRQIRTRLSDPLAIGAMELKDIERLLSRLTQYDHVFADYHQHPWNGLLSNSFSFEFHEKVESTLTDLANAIERVLPQVELLSKYGLVSSTPRFTDLAAAIKPAQDLLAYPLLPAEWFGGDPVALARSILSLHEAEREYESTAATVSEFEIDGRPFSQRTRELVAAFRRHPYLRCLQLSPTVMLQQCKQHVEQSLSDLTRFRQSIIALREGVDDFSRHFGFRINSNSSLGVLHKLVALEAIVADSGRLRAAWFEPTQRDKLLELKARCQDDIQACDEITDQHRGSWSAVAYEKTGADIARHGIEFEPFWQRLWAIINGRWRQFGEEYRQLYRRQTPQTAVAVLDDLRSLRDYHRRSTRIRELVAVHQENLILNAKGQPDWEALQRGLDVVGRLQSLIKISDELKEHLCSVSSINRTALHDSAIEFGEELKQLDKQATEVSKRFSLAEFGERRFDYKSFSPSDLEAHLKAAEESLAEFRTAIAEIESRLSPGADIAISSLPEAFNRLDSLLEHRTDIAERRATLTNVRGTNGSVVSSHNVSSQDAAAAKVTIELVRKYSVLPAIQVAPIVTDAATKEQVCQAAVAMESALDDELTPLWENLSQLFQTSKPVSFGVTIDDLSIQGVANWSRRLSTRINELEEWTELAGIKSGLEQRGLSAIFDELLENGITSGEVVDAFRSKFYRSWLDAAYAKDQMLTKFQAHEHEALLDEFRNLDRDSIDGAYKRIRTRLLEDPERPRIGAISAPPSSELGILLREASRKRPRMPLRQLFRKIPRILMRLKPCVMMSPLAVSTFLDSPEFEFDIVIFDEASQVRPYDAIGAIYRGKQLLVAGDQKQLPPTRFFDVLDTDSDQNETDDDADDAGSLSEFESILDKCCSLGMTRKRLRWHYRSRRESLITFSNRFIYDNELITFPSVLDTQGSSAVTHHYVPQGRWVPNKSGGGFNPVEAEELIKLIIQQLEQEPDKSVGVITFNQAQQMEVLERLNDLRSNRPELADLLSESRDEPIFVKNIETVQGDERDVILLGVVYGFNAENKFAMRFGPLNQQGGERRLNVAVTRARYKTIVVSSFQADQIDLKRTNSRGTTLLRNYLDFASRGIAALDAASTESADSENDSEFEAAVETALKSRGLDVRRQIGCSGFRIDLAVVHPERPGKYILGIECDGATYHSSATARDRDRLRQEILEGLGWTFCRIWSTDWVRNPERQISRVISAYEEALARSDGTPNDIVPADCGKSSEQDAEEPILLKIVNKTTRLSTYPNIDVVPEDVIQNAIMQILRKCGRTTRDDLIKSVARQLGFQRTGHKIQNRIDQTIEQLARKKHIYWAEEDCIAAS